MSILDRILNAIGVGFAWQTQALAMQQREIEEISQVVKSNGAKLDQIIGYLTEPAPITGATLTFEETDMSKLHHNSNGKMKFVLNDNGTATGTITFTDSVDAPTTPAAGASVSTTVTSSDPGVTVSVDATGLVVTATPVTPIPTPIPTGVVVTAVITITNADGTVIGPLTCDNSADPLNVIAGGPAGATILFA